ncbi:hypothetical protein HYC85_030707 [Camellia sinensis]|uniref:Uncharacterized protein n=1 Tax=Camellia sinensis TaxID=4442 RepID=A0A7J7G5G9_CAMSI|nr:hypothetical protein HYC85_030707 [Camellia sinensis]
MRCSFLLSKRGNRVLRDRHGGDRRQCHWGLFIDEKLVAVARGAAVEGNEVWVTEAGEDLYFVHELLHSFEIVFVKLLHCNYTPVSNPILSGPQTSFGVGPKR